MRSILSIVAVWFACFGVLVGLGAVVPDAADAHRIPSDDAYHAIWNQARPFCGGGPGWICEQLPYAGATGCWPYKNHSWTCYVRYRECALPVGIPCRVRERDGLLMNHSRTVTWTRYLVLG